MSLHVRCAVLLLALTGPIVHAASVSTAAPPTAAELQQIYRDYNEALLRKDGAAAARHLHPDLLGIYQRAQTMAFTADEQTLRAAPPHLRLVALYLRWSKAPLTGDSRPEHVVAFMVSQGVLRSDAGVSTDLRDFEIEPTQAVASLYAKNNRTPLRIRFAPVDGNWKIDLTQIQSYSDDIYAQTAERMNTTVDEALLRMVASYTGRPVTAAIWAPLDRAPASVPLSDRTSAGN